LEAKLKPEFGVNPVESLWTAFEKSETGSPIDPPRSQTRRFTDLVSLVRVALEQEPVLQPFEEHVRSRFDEWIEMKRGENITFTGDQMTWLQRMRDYIVVGAWSASISMPITCSDRCTTRLANGYGP
jgi:type I restriction enzyme, R subunit